MDAPSHNALRSMWGDGPKHSYKCTKCRGSGIVSGPGEYTTEACNECGGDGVMQKPANDSGNERPQEVYTTQCIVDAILKVWPEGIALDPCSGPHSIVPSARLVMPVPPGTGMPWAYVFAYAGESGNQYLQATSDGGLGIDWPARTFFNPPYNKLQPWLTKYQHSWEVMGLLPVRSRRKWWRAAALESSAICYLNSLRFMWWDGEALAPHPKGAFPGDLCMMYRGDRIDAFRAAFADLGGFYHC